MNKKQIALLVIACVALIILIFLAGMLSGMMMRASGSANHAATAKNQNMGGSGSAVPMTPQSAAGRAKGLVASKQAAVMSKARQPAQAIRSPGSTSGEQGEAGQEELADKDSKADTKETRSASDDQKKDEQKTEDAPPSDTRFSVEVESFVSKTKALNMVSDLTAKGWGEASVLKMQDTGDRNNVWYLVQIGDYDHAEAAYHAASEFEDKEGIVAAVRSMDPKILEQRKMGE
ncbi:SPOR domain-containing protein [Desulfonema magnum]|uniref:SPOR domain-containing protein n=1 Tax=Desulfonema magnum TaxID=45655 RepID=UPI001A9AA659|nr:SPOR domain-containing protein [Desulfonema magnum]